ncbi:MULTISPECIES: nuclear transport factor 2 family protein [unclassified Paracoccus (in: a-proteobacteria)]|uniref:nuclear transport factor 2 family protein n=1 Tax=unclassified Paracoccus (in: a-proteobacteria) TaxID=2688777 RepID=UPI0012B3E415|nr:MULTISPECIES: nuclear transport factor 2 family protein [unclassified Paracoccus (in: a-proteobacteria)]UXU74219.1 nuclear transport factor 2 family protein [Paracoccus sp. SMMA_5]UXU80109.1 nuclear transport factor 2 family protein [Paracoccus sp. SMMA_5_TC]
MADDLWREERDFWLAGVAEAARKLDEACLMAFAGTGILTRRRVVESLSAVPRWQEITMTDRASIETDDLCVLAYRATARRPGADTYRAICTTTWIRRDGDWRIVQHQQTAV